MSHRNPAGVEAAVFDLDGVITFTASLHAAAWKEIFDEFLRRREGASRPSAPFTDEDYRRYVDGRPRLDGVRTFLGSRGIDLPEASGDAEADAETVESLGDRKNAAFNARLDRTPIPVDEEAVRLIRELKSAGARVGVATSSRNGRKILERTGLDSLFDARVDGDDSERLGLSGKPHPDIFLACLRGLGVDDPSDSAMLEDAEVGVRAGRDGGFGLVIGVDRDGHAISLREQGADWVIRDFSGVDARRVGRHLAALGHGGRNAIAAWPELRGELDGRRFTVLVTTGLAGALETASTAEPNEPNEPAKPATSGVDRVIAERAALLEELGGGGGGESVLYLGTDEEDEAVFAALGGQGIGVLVGELPRPTSARYWLQDTVETRELLLRLAALREVEA